MLVINLQRFPAYICCSARIARSAFSQVRKAICRALQSGHRRCKHCGQEALQFSCTMAIVFARSLKATLHRTLALDSKASHHHVIQPNGWSPAAMGV